MNKKPKTVSNDITNDNIIVIDLTNENIVIDTLTAEGDTNNNGQVLLCQEILKTGKNKGTQCGSKVFENNLCKRHSNKQLTTNI